MASPRVEINLEKIAHNATTLRKHYAGKGIELIGVTKVVCGHPAITKVLVDSGIGILADSRISNIKKMLKEGVAARFLMLRTPLLSQLKEVIDYTDISHNTELSIIIKLSEIAVKQGMVHKIILMVELGDLREGILPCNLAPVIAKIKTLKGVEIVGLGTNLACFGGIMPDEKNMTVLSAMVEDAEHNFALSLKFVSGGNSANYNWFQTTKNVGRINYLRVGESIFLGTEPLFRKQIPGLFTDAFTFVAEIIESNTKPSVPYGGIGQDAFGSVPQFKDQGQMKRAIAGAGLQDVVVSGLTPRLDIEILGASSDHIIINSKQKQLKVGEEVEFDMNYAALLSSMTSPYVAKIDELL